MIPLLPDFQRNLPDGPSVRLIADTGIGDQDVDGTEVFLGFDHGSTHGLFIRHIPLDGKEVGFWPFGQGLAGPEIEAGDFATVFWTCRLISYFRDEAEGGSRYWMYRVGSPIKVVTAAPPIPPAAPCSRTMC